MHALIQRKKEERLEYVCGYCAVGWHESCPRTIQNGKKAPTPVTRCHCDDPSHASDAAA